MSLLLTDTAQVQKSDIHGESRAFVLLETARLRSEALMAHFGPSEHLMSIHHEVGMAGYVTCGDFDTGHRQLCLTLAAAQLAGDRFRRSDGPLDLSRTLAMMFSETIAASDALASELGDHDVDDAHRERLHEVHTHVMCACELLDERLTVLELEGAGFKSH